MKFSVNALEDLKKRDRKMSMSENWNIWLERRLYLPNKTRIKNRPETSKFYIWHYAGLLNWIELSFIFLIFFSTEHSKKIQGGAIGQPKVAFHYGPASFTFFLILCSTCIKNSFTIIIRHRKFQKNMNYERHYFLLA